MPDKRMLGQSVVFNEEARKLTEQLPLLLQRKAAKKALRAAAKIVQAEAKRRAPRSSEQTGTRDSWSKSTRARREKFKPLKRSIKVYTDKKAKGAEIRFRVWAPSAAWLEFGHTNRTHKHWGRDSGQKLRPTPFLRPAADNTLPAQQAAVVETIKKELEKEAKKHG